MPDKAFRSRRTEFRAADPAEGQPMTLSGYFVVFGQPYYIDDWCEEVVDRHAFDDADMTDVRALIDHDPRLCLGRHNDNVETLEFSIDDTGLFATIQINPDDTDALSLRARVLRGDVDQASFGFEESSVEYTDLPDGRVRRTIRKISKLWEVSVCTFPAYEQTYVSARSASGDALRRSVLEHRKTKLKRRLKHHGKNKLLLKKQRSLKAKKLTELRTRAKQLRAQEDELAQQLAAVEDAIPEDLEQQITEVTDAQTEVNDQIGTLVDELADLDALIAEVDAGEPAPEDDPPADPPARSRTPAATAPESGRFRSRSRCFASRTQRDAFYASSPVKTFLQRIRDLASRGVRSVTGAQLTIPKEVLDILRDNLNQYSKLISKVRLRSVSGEARQNIIGKCPEGIWMEMAGALNSLEFRISEIETDGYKVGGFIVIDNYILKDSDIALGEEIMYMLGQSIGYALDKAIVFGLGPNSKMPVGIMTRLAQTAQPAYWGDNQGDWVDLHSSNVLKLNLASANGTAFFIPLLQALAKAKPTFTTDGKVWIMNDLTRQDLQIRALEFNSNAALLSGIENTMPVIGGEIITLEFMPDHMICGGYCGEYLLVEREGGTFASSDIPFFLQDKTVYKGTARYDGQPVSGEAFVGATYDNTEVTTTLRFAPDYVNTPANSLVVTSAAGAESGETKLTVAGAVSASNTFKAFVGAPAAVAKGDVPGKGWTTIVSGTTSIAAPTGSGVTVVELDENGRVISIGYCASVTAKT